MENDIISLFLARKKQNISKYCDIFVNHTLKTKGRLSNIIEKIVEIYIDNFYIEKNTDFSLLTKYFELGKTNESLMKNILLSSLLFYKNSGLESQISSDIKTIVVLSNSIYLSLSLDNYINNIKNDNTDIKVKIDLFFDKYKNKFRITEEQFESLSLELINAVKKDYTNEKKFWKSLNNTNFILDFNKCNNIDYFITNYRYDIKLLNRYDSNEIEKISYTKGIIDDIITIYLEKLSVFILKDLLCENYEDLFFINIYCDYFNKNKNLINIERIMRNKSIKSRIVFGFKLSEANKNINVIKYLNSKEYMSAIVDIDEELTQSSFDMFNYVFISSELLNKYKDYKQLWDIKKIEFIVDNDKLVNMSDDEILNRTR